MIYFRQMKQFAVMLPPLDRRSFSCWYLDGHCWVVSPFAFVILSSANSVLVKMKWLSATAAALGSFLVSCKRMFLQIIPENSIIWRYTMWETLTLLRCPENMVEIWAFNLSTLPHPNTKLIALTFLLLKWCSLGGHPNPHISGVMHETKSILKINEGSHLFFCTVVDILKISGCSCLFFCIVILKNWSISSLFLYFGRGWKMIGPASLPQYHWSKVWGK